MASAGGGGGGAPSHVVHSMVNTVLNVRMGLFAHAKGDYSAQEPRLRQSVWDWLRGLAPAELERVSATQTSERGGGR